jgi:hypothetical protein
MIQEKPVCLAATTTEFADHLRAMFDAQKETSSHLLSDLRRLVLKRSSVALAAEQKEITRRLRQIERAIHFYRSAETEIEVLISNFGDRR